MKYLDEFRDPQKAAQLLQQIRDRATRKWVLMEVCGGQTHSLMKYGITEQLRDHIEMIHGPGCPVCVTPAEDIDLAARIATQPNTVLFSFGDMLRVPGTAQSLQQIQASGGNVKPVYSPLDAVEYARANPTIDVVFFAVGFETTVPATALAVLQAEQLKLQNFRLLVSHVRVQPAMEAILADDHNRVQAFLAAGHVCTVAGFNSYEAMRERWKVPVVVTGFEPVDLLEGILSCVAQLESGEHAVDNQYARCVTNSGNEDAMGIVNRVYAVADRPWRGLGTIGNGGFVLRPEFAQFDARVRYQGEKTKVLLPVVSEDIGCEAADVLSGRIRPNDCEAFGKECTPDSPLGAPMVSSEGACAAYFRFGQVS